MSSPHVIVSAVYKPESSIEDWWQNNRDDLDSFEKEYNHNDEVDWRFCKGTFKSYEALEEYPVRAEYHSGRKEEVIEIIFSGKKDIQNIQMTGLEKVIAEINDELDSNFTLEVYYWYTGVDKPGGQKR